MATQVVEAPVQSPCATFVGEPIDAPFNRLMACALAALISVECVLAKMVHLTGMAHSLRAWPGLLILLVVLCYCRWRPLPRLIQSAEMVIWTMILAALLPIVIQTAGRSPSPLRDEQLNAIDAHFYFHTAAIVHLTEHFPAIDLTLRVMYDSLPLLAVAAILLLPVCKPVNACRTYILSVLLSTVITAILFALWPAAGPWTTQKFAPQPNQVAVGHYLLLLKSHISVAMQAENAGVVSFPSFHVVLAILSAIALNSFRAIRIPVWALTAVICISTVTTGWHYGIDVLGGVIVAIGSKMAAAQIVSRLQSIPVRKDEKLFKNRTLESLGR